MGTTPIFERTPSPPDFSALDSLLSDIIARAPGAPYPSNQPLYRYSTTADEQDRLAALLPRTLSVWGTAALGSIATDTVAAAFCLFGSRCISDTYSGGVWTWDLVTARLPGVRLEPATLRS